jgi:hypothetical protein
MAIQVRDTSRQRFAKLVELSGVEFWELWEPPVIDEAPDDIFYTVARNDRIDLLAFRFYNSAELWWVIALANDFRLLPNDMTENMRLRVPSPARVFTKILRGANRGEEGR